MKYRCSCCNQLKKEKGNKVYKLWNQNIAPERSEVVGICKKCNLFMRKANFKGVLQFLKRGIK